MDAGITLSVPLSTPLGS